MGFPAHPSMMIVAFIFLTGFHDIPWVSFHVSPAPCINQFITTVVLLYHDHAELEYTIFYAQVYRVP